MGEDAAHKVMFDPSNDHFSTQFCVDEVFRRSCPLVVVGLSTLSRPRKPVRGRNKVRTSNPGSKKVKLQLQLLLFLLHKKWRFYPSSEESSSSPSSSSPLGKRGIWINEFGLDGGPAARALRPKLNLYSKHVLTQTGIKLPEVEIKHLVAGTIVLKGVGSLLFIFGSSLGAYLLLIHQAIVTPILYDFYNHDADKKEHALLFVKFTQNLALFGALVVFIGMKNSMTRRSAKKKSPKQKTGCSVVVWTDHLESCNGFARQALLESRIPDSFPLIKSILLLDSEGKKVAVKYCSDEWPTNAAKLAFEKSVFTKTQKTNARSEDLAAEITLLDNNIIVYKFIEDLHFFVIGGDDENELILDAVLQGFCDAVSLLLRSKVDKYEALENLDVVLLCLDEIIDGGMVLETDANVIVGKVATNTIDSGAPLSEQTISQALALAREHFTRSLLS
ncbi:Coatomer subunit zeta-2-like protein [Drosera capensis]